MQGIWPIQLLFSKIHRENICEFSNICEGIPYADEQGISSREQG